MAAYIQCRWGVVTLLIFGCALGTSSVASACPVDSEWARFLLGREDDDFDDIDFSYETDTETLEDDFDYEITIEGDEEEWENFDVDESLFDDDDSFGKTKSTAVFKSANREKKILGEFAKYKKLLDPYKKKFSKILKKKKKAKGFFVGLAEGAKKAKSGKALKKGELKAAAPAIKKGLQSKVVLDELTLLYACGEFIAEHGGMDQGRDFQRVVAGWKSANVRSKGRLLGFLITKRGE